MRAYYRVMLGKKSAFAAQSFAGGFIGTGFEIDEDLSRLDDDKKLRWALAVVPNVAFYRYEIRFKLVRS